MTLKRNLLVLAIALSTTLPMSAATIPTDGVELLIPIAGYAPGANREFFSTDLTLVNLSRNNQNIRLTWLPAGGTALPITRTVDFERLTHGLLTDVVRQLFGAEGIGAIHISASDPTLLNPPAIDASARVFTQTISGLLRGTVSHNVPAIRLEGWRNGSPAWIHGVRQSPGFRANYGIVNLDSQPHDFRVVVNSPGGRFEEMVTVPANGLVHRPVPGNPDGGLSMFIEPRGSSGPWRAYASTTDNESGSSWTVIAIQARTDVQF